MCLWAGTGSTCGMHMRQSCVWRGVVCGGHVTPHAWSKSECRGDNTWLIMQAASYMTLTSCRRHCLAHSMALNSLCVPPWGLRLASPLSLDARDSSSSSRLCSSVRTSRPRPRPRWRSRSRQQRPAAGTGQAPTWVQAQAQQVRGWGLHGAPTVIGCVGVAMVLRVGGGVCACACVFGESGQLFRGAWLCFALFLTLLVHLHRRRCGYLDLCQLARNWLRSIKSCVFDRCHQGLITCASSTSAMSGSSWVCQMSV